MGQIVDISKWNGDINWPVAKQYSPSQTLLISYSSVNSTEIFRASLPLLNPFSLVEGHTLNLLLEKAMYI